MQSRIGTRDRPNLRLVARVGRAFRPRVTSGAYPPRGLAHPTRTSDAAPRDYHSGDALRGDAFRRSSFVVVHRIVRVLRRSSSSWTRRGPPPAIVVPRRAREPRGVHPARLDRRRRRERRRRAFEPREIDPERAGRRPRRRPRRPRPPRRVVRRRRRRGVGSSNRVDRAPARRPPARDARAAVSSPALSRSPSPPATSTPPSPSASPTAPPSPNRSAG